MKQSQLFSGYSGTILGKNMDKNAGLTLTQLAYYGRKVIKFGSIALVVLIVGRTFLTAAVGYWVATHPAAPPPPTARFGALPQLNFLAQQILKNQPATNWKQQPAACRFLAIGRKCF